MMAESGAPEPRRILVAGDWHGNEDWAVSVIRRVPSMLAGEPRRLILQLGDFGVWPDRVGRRYLTRISALLAEVDAELWFIDGNHEDFPQLARLASDRTPDGRVVVRPRLFHLPRGYRWTWHGLRWLGCGGGVSLDRAVRTEGVDWFPAEEITDAQEAAVIAAGHADVLVSHDCPAGVAHTFGRPRRGGTRPTWPVRRTPAAAAAHRGRRPAVPLMHGHLHRTYQRSCDFGYGPVQVTGLDADNRLRNFAVLDVAEMRWELRDGWFGQLRRGLTMLCNRLPPCHRRGES